MTCPDFRSGSNSTLNDGYRRGIATSPTVRIATVLGGRAPAWSTPVATVHVGRNGDFSESVRVDSAEMEDEAKRMSYIRRRSAYPALALVVTPTGPFERRHQRYVSDISAKHQHIGKASASHQHCISIASALDQRDIGKTQHISKPSASYQQ